MKTTRKRITAEEVGSGKQVVKEVKKPKTRAPRKPLKAKDKASHLPDGALCSRFQEKNTCILEATTDNPALHLNSGQTHPSSKMKLQLFPIDEGTCLGLEKDGLHPYLELTLSTRKKMSSVLRHIKSKWGNSSIAVGEPLLFPYDLAMGTHRWTMNDTSISAGDVYTTIGRPAVFRLRYGWSSDFETKATELPSISASFEARLGSESVQRDSSDRMELPLISASFQACLGSEIVERDSSDRVETACGNSEKVEMRNEENAKTDVSIATDAVSDEKIFPDLAINSMDNEARMATGMGQPLLLLDNQAGISVGALLSEVTPQDKRSNPDPKSPDLAVSSMDKKVRMATGMGQPLLLLDNQAGISVGALLSEVTQDKCIVPYPKSNGNNAGMQPPQSSSNSFEAFLSGLRSQSEAPKPPNHIPSSSFFDAENTCHAFSFQKHSSSGTDTTVVSASTCPQIWSQDTNSKPFKFPILTKSNPPIELPEVQASQESVFNNENSMGLQLSRIKWSEPSIPFGLDMTSTRKTEG